MLMKALPNALLQHWYLAAVWLLNGADQRTAVAAPDLNGFTPPGMVISGYQTVS